MELTPDLMVINPHSKTVEFRDRYGETVKTLESGRRKLILVDFTIFTYFWDPVKVPEPVLLTVGAAPGTHLPFILEFFPQITKIIAYDPAEFTIQSSKKIEIHNEFFTNEIAEKFANRKDIIFFSDIRAGRTSDMTTEQFEQQILIPNMEAQSKWYKIIKPQLASLKFRLPFAREGEPPSFKYLRGTLVKQVWTAFQSNEVRLVPDGNVDIDYDKKWYGDCMYYHNSVLRNDINFLNPLTTKDKLKPIYDDELLNDFDSVFEATVFKEYCIKYSGKYTSKMVIAMSKATTDEMNRGKKKYRRLEDLRFLAQKKSIEGKKVLPNPTNNISLNPIDNLDEGENVCELRK